MKKNILLLILSFIALSDFSQTLPLSRKVNWENAGLQGPVPSYTAFVNINNYGGVGDSLTINNNAFQSALAALNGHSGVIYFPTGKYKFNATLTLPDSVVLRGNSKDSSILLFDLGGAISNLINIYGSQSSTTANVNGSLLKDSVYVCVNSTAGFAVGDFIKLYQNDVALMASSWAYNSLGQVARISSIINNNTLRIDGPLRKDYVLSDSAKIVKLNMARAVGIECLKIKRLDATTSQSTNIDMDKAAYCWLLGVESEMANYAHVALSTSSHIYISGCYMHHAFAYGGSGQGYGVAAQFTTGDCLIENNIFNHLRHSMLLQAGANGNVFAYNSSTDPYWNEGFFPTNSAGDMVLHGNYPYANLFEGNNAQNLVIDNSHGKNGPYNTFFRNRAGTWGIYMNSNPASDYQNLIGNEVTNNTAGLYTITGTGTFEYGNNNKGTITPAGTSSLPESSYYLGLKPGFFTAGFAWPALGTPVPFNTGTVPASTHQQNSIFTDCSSYNHIPYNNISHVNMDATSTVYPNPASAHCTLVSTHLKEGGTLFLRDLLGRTITTHKLPEGSSNYTLDLSQLNNGIYLVDFENASVKISKKIIKQ